MQETIKKDSKIMEMLKVSTINRIVCNTDKGMLTLQIRKGESKYELVLDSVPLLPEVNKELMDILFPVKEMEKPKQVNKEPVIEIGVDFGKEVLVKPKAKKAK